MNVIIMLFVLVFIFILVGNLMQWQKNNESPELTVAAQIMEKRKKHHHHNNGNHHHTSTSYHLTFRVKSGDTMEMKVRRSLYNELDEEMVGYLTFKGTRFIAFDRQGVKE